MIYPKLDTHENGKLTECPNCQNEETDIEGDYCQICGRNLINKCSYDDCYYNEPLPANARYCPICGNHSTFYNAGFLKEWNYERNSSNNLFPSQLLPKSGKKAWWKCSSCGHEWYAVIASRVKGHGCPHCSKRRKK